MTRDPVGVNGIDPARQGIEKRSIEFSGDPIEIPGNPIAIPGDPLEESLANRANAIMPTAGCANAPTVFFVIDRHQNATHYLELLH